MIAASEVWEAAIDMFDKDYQKLMAYVDDNREVFGRMTHLCENEEITDVATLAAYYKFCAMERACPLLGLIENSNPLENNAELQKKIITVIQDFDNAISEFVNSNVESEEDEDEESSRHDESLDEDILFDKIKNLSSSFRYYCEEIGELMENV